MSSDTWRVRGRDLDLGSRSLVMGILNVTPDSFSDGGRHVTLNAAIETAEQMVTDGADIIDVGGESTRPRRPETITAEVEVERVLPVVRELRGRFPQVLLSVDTYRGEVAEQCLDAGADIINDVYALRRSPAMVGAIARHGAGVILMHMLGDPETMQDNPQYRHVLVDVKDLLKEQMLFAVENGIPEECIAVDPGIGFGKTLEHNLRLVAGLEYLRLLQRPICVGASRKGFLGTLTGGLPASEREEATIAISCAAAMNGASIVRVHNVKAMKRALTVIDALKANQ